MKKNYRIIVLVILVFVLGTSVVDTMAQSDDQPLDDEFVEALVMMSINHNMMEGKTEIRDLTALRDFVRDYYDDRIEATNGNVAILHFNSRKKQFTSKLDMEINKRSGIDLIDTMLMVFTDEKGLNIARDSMGIKLFVSGSEEPPGDYFEAMNSLTMTDFEAQVNLLLDIDTITVQPNLTSLIVDNSSWSLNLPAISDSTASITLPGENEPQLNTEITDDSAPIYDNDGGNLKPVCFNNNGYEAATVIVDYFKPAAGLDSKKITASTVVFPESGTSACLNLPLGTYTFCYYWELEKDTNNDGYYDYHHYTTDVFTLDAEASDNPKSAKTITLTTDSTISNPNGKCGEDLAPIYTEPANPAPAPANPAPDKLNASGLTPEEAANAGTHTYYVEDGNGGYKGYESVTVDFSGNSVDIIKHDIGSEYTLTRDGPNRYSWVHDSGINYLIITFSSDGFLWNYGDISFTSHTLAD